LYPIADANVPTVDPCSQRLRYLAPVAITAENAPGKPTSHPPVRGQTPFASPHPQPQSLHFGAARSGTGRGGTSGSQPLLEEEADEDDDESLDADDALEADDTLDADDALEADDTLEADESLLVEDALDADDTLDAEETLLSDDPLEADERLLALDADDAEEPLLSDEALDTDDALDADERLLADDALDAEESELNELESAMSTSPEGGDRPKNSEIPTADNQSNTHDNERATHPYRGQNAPGGTPTTPIALTSVPA
jgi:hypothetical protein